MKILVATDAWHPQVNGVVRTYERLTEEAAELGHEITLLTPAEFNTVPCPTYPEIRLALPGYNYVIDRLDLINPDAVHIATEGPIGWMTRRYCRKRGVPFTTSFHTRFPEYVSSRFGVPASWIYAWQRHFHNAGEGMMVASASLARDLEMRGFERIMPWTRGVDTELFRPRDVRLFGSDKPVLIYVGRVAVEKNIEAFLRLDIDGHKVVVGTGPQLEAFKSNYSDVTFTGKLSGEALAEAYASADVFVFPSLTDTFGIVLLEAMASGVPVAAYPVTGPIDNVQSGVTGVLDEDLAVAVRGALALDRSAVRQGALGFSWENAARMFMGNIEQALFARQGRRVPARKSRRRLLKRRRPQVG
ncbi:MAG: glycosyltransferase involved in cell wall biosynthesis [Alphaproteobacteria bacterium]|jgi:glycosyltransferase involved in cell wall biosynthesis